VSIRLQIKTLFCLVASAALIAAAHSAFSQAPPANRSQPVLVELFTSEGCSDCPPADALLAKIDATQFVPGAHAIVLSEHVTYWDRLGWRDPFSLDLVTTRQQDYAQAFGLRDIYTPQMIVDGQTQLVGSDSSALTRAVAHAITVPKPDLVIEKTQWTHGDVHFAVRVPAGTKGDLIAVLAANETHTEVTRGENAGRTLHHVAVARAFKDFGVVFADGRPIQLSAPFSNEEKQTGPLRLIVFLVDRGNGRVLAVAEQDLKQPG
jgi:hypothetical protein